jgi:hypothetical protein
MKNFSGRNNQLTSAELPIHYIDLLIIKQLQKLKPDRSFLYSINYFLINILLYTLLIINIFLFY